MKTHTQRGVTGSVLLLLLSIPAPTALAFTITETRYTAEFVASASFFDIDTGDVIAADSSSDSTQGSISGPLPWSDVLSLNVNPVSVNVTSQYAEVTDLILRLSHYDEYAYANTLSTTDGIDFFALSMRGNGCQSSGDCVGSLEVNAVTANAFQVTVEQDFSLAGPATIDFYLYADGFGIGGFNTSSFMLEDMNGNSLFSLASGYHTNLSSEQSLAAGNYTVSYSWTHQFEMSTPLGPYFAQEGEGEYGSLYFNAFITHDPVSAVPIPAAAWLFVTGLISLAGVSWKKRRN